MNVHVINHGFLIDSKFHIVANSLIYTKMDELFKAEVSVHCLYLKRLRLLVDDSGIVG